jgi:MarR family transcriptional regulator, organic hydroperoxide resistance regulator
MQDERLAHSLGYALVRAFRVVNRATGRALQPYGLSAEQAHILLVLWLEGTLKVGELQRLLALSSGTLTGALDRMEKIGLVRRVKDPEDGRAWRVEPAAFETKKRRELEGILERLEGEIFGGLTGRERAELLRLLTKIAEPPR